VRQQDAYTTNVRVRNIAVLFNGNTSVGNYLRRLKKH